MCLLVTSCQKIMHEEQLSLSKIETKEELIDATNALYGLTTLITVPVLYQSLNGDDLSYYPPNYRYTIDKSCVYKNSHYYEYIRENNWNAEYTAIASANNIILQYKPGKKDKKIDMIVGESYFFKAYLYWFWSSYYCLFP
jgi:hypothetical protein